MIGIIGGMGIEAGQKFQRTLGVPSVRSDACHPCRIAALRGDGISPAKSIALAALEMAERYDVSQFILACNTAHLFLPEIEAYTHIRFIDMVSIVEATLPAYTTVLGTTFGLECGLYSGLQRPTEREQAIIQDAIWRVKVGDYSLAGQVQAIAQQYGSVLAGCTEIPLLLNGSKFYDPAIIIKEILK